MKTLFLLPVAALLMLASCESVHNSKIAGDFDKGTKAYFRMVRWNELDKTPLYFVDEKVRDEFRKRVEAAREVQITDYRVRNMECQPEKGVGEVTVEWDYYIPPSIRLKTVEDQQKWRHIEEKDKEGWMLMTLFPEFK